MPTKEQCKAILQLERLATSPDGRRWIPGKSLDELKLALLEILPEIKERLILPLGPSSQALARQKREALEAARNAAANALQKKCPVCNTTKAGTEFNKRTPFDLSKPIKLASWCRSCTHGRARARYQAARSKALDSGA